MNKEYEPCGCPKGACNCAAQENKEGWEAPVSPRMYGKNTKAMLEFYHEGISGRAVVFSTPKGDFLSPKAADNLKSLSYQEGLNRAREVIIEHGHQQEDDTIWCNMDEVLTALDHEKRT